MARTVLGWRHVTAVLVVVGLAAAFAAAPAHAQPVEFRNTLELYLMGAAMSGDVGFGPLETTIDVPAPTIFENLKLAALVDYRGEAPEWAVTADVVYMALGADGTSSHGAAAAAVDVDQTIVDVVGSWRLSQRFELLGGARYTGLGTKVETTTPVGDRTVKMYQGWIDPVVGAQAFLPLSSVLQLQVRGDIGGFDVGCTFTWQATVRVNWQVSKKIFLGFGYRVLDQDYETGTGTEYFHWDVVSQGPLLAVDYVF